jgi:hypothetical protein
MAYWLWEHGNSRWPDKTTRDAAWPGDKLPSTKHPDEIQKAIKTIQTCIDERKKFPEINLKVIDDLLQ